MQPLNISVSVELTVSEQLKSLLSGLFQGHKAMPETQAEKQEETAKSPDATVAEVTDEMLRQAVRAAKARVGVPEIRGVFKQFGIEASSECPSERRVELKNSLDQLGN